MTREEIKAYLTRLGIREIERPTEAYLFELHKAHMKNIPWETVDIFAGRPASIHVRESVQLILNGRSGYCFHLNGAFSELLRSLGYRVFWHRSGIQPHGGEPRIDSFHIGVTVSLPGEEEERRWIVDVGLGDMPYEPLPLQAGAYKQGPFTYTVRDSEVVKNGWRLDHDLPASFIGVDFAPEVVPDMEEFEPKHAFYSRSADSPWANLFLIQHRNASGSNELRGCIFSRREEQGIERTEILTKSQWLEVLGDVFGERLVHYSGQERDDLWKRVLNIHEEWRKSASL